MSGVEAARGTRSVGPTPYTGYTPGLAPVGVPGGSAQVGTVPYHVGGAFVCMRLFFMLRPPSTRALGVSRDMVVESERVGVLGRWVGVHWGAGEEHGFAWACGCGDSGGVLYV